MSIQCVVNSSALKYYTVGVEDVSSLFDVGLDMVLTGFTRQHVIVAYVHPYRLISTNQAVERRGLTLD